MFRGWHGIGLDGNNSQRFLLKLQDLKNEPESYKFIPVIQCLEKFAIVKSMAFGTEKHPDLDKAVVDFKAEF